MASLRRRKTNRKKVYRYYLQSYLGGKRLPAKNLRTTSLQIAKQQKRDFESARALGVFNPFPTETSPATILTAYVERCRARKSPKSVQNDIYRLRDIFGACCPALENTSLKPTSQSEEPPTNSQIPRHRKPHVLRPQFIEQITTGDIADFIESRKNSRGLSAKTANDYRALLHHLFHWAMKKKKLRMPGGENPVADVERYVEDAPEIVYLEHEDIEKQLDALRDYPRLQAAVATYIYAGLRREELLWLTHKDIDWNTNKRGTIHIRAKTIGEEKWQAKTKKNRSIPVSKSLRPYLDKQRLLASKSIWFFPNSEGGRYDPDNFSADLRAANNKAGLTWGCLHYRHTFATLLAKRGVPLIKIASLMGNSAQIVERHYASMRPETLEDAVEFGPPPAHRRPEAVSVISA